eukprot:912197_1
MGSALSKSNNKQEPSKQFVNHRINSSYPVAIQHWLFNHFHCMEIPPHPDIIDLCLQFVGYLMDSHICSVSDTCILYNLMLSDHQHRRNTSNDKGHFCNMSHPSNQQYDTIGNELLGGDVLKLDSSAEFISLKRIEVFHILSTLT